MNELEKLIHEYRIALKFCNTKDETNIKESYNAILEVNRQFFENYDKLKTRCYCKFYYSENKMHKVQECESCKKKHDKLKNKCSCEFYILKESDGYFKIKECYNCKKEIFLQYISADGCTVKEVYDNGVIIETTLKTKEDVFSHIQNLLN